MIKKYSLVTSLLGGVFISITAIGALQCCKEIKTDIAKNRAYKIADTDKDGFIQNDELYSFGKELKLITNDESLQRKELEDRINNCSFEIFQKYLNNHNLK